MTSVSSLIAPALVQYLELSAFDIEHRPYVFCCKDPQRCMTSSQWSAYAKSVFLRWSGVACPPRMCNAPRLLKRHPSTPAGMFILRLDRLRASFVTWLRNHTDCPETLKSAARAMRHEKQTADSDKYDKESNGKCNALKVCENVQLAVT